MEVGLHDTNLAAQQQPYAIAQTAEAPAQGPVAPPAGTVPRKPPKFDTKKLIENNQIHIHDASIQLDGNPYLFVNPRDLHPQQDATLRTKVARHVDAREPNFFGADAKRAGIATMLSQLVPVSLETKEHMISKGLVDHAQHQQMGTDPSAIMNVNQRQQPMRHLIDVTTKPLDLNANPAFSEKLKQSIALYLVVEQAMKDRGYQKPITHYVRGGQNPEAILAELSEKLTVSIGDMRTALALQGIEGFGATLGVDPKHMKEIGEVVEHGSQHRYSNNMFHHWQLGRNAAGSHGATVEEKIAKGRETDITQKVNSLRAQAKGRYDIPDFAKESEAYIAGQLSLLPPVITELLYELEADIVYTSAGTLKPVFPSMPALGLHAVLSNQFGDTEAPRNVYASQNGDHEKAERTLVHECNHLFFPKQFDAETVHQMDGLLRHDIMRLQRMKPLIVAWKQATDEQGRHDLIDRINNEFAIGNLRLNDVISSDREMNRFCNQALHALTYLDPDGPEYVLKGYAPDFKKTQEIVSRYSEIRDVVLRDNAAMCAFIAPGMTQIYDQHYLKHLEQQLADIKTAKASQHDHGAALAQGMAAFQPAQAAEGGKLHLPTTAEKNIHAALGDVGHHAVLHKAATQLRAPEQTVGAFTSRLAAEATQAERAQQTLH